MYNKENMLEFIEFTKKSNGKLILNLDGNCNIEQIPYKKENDKIQIDHLEKYYKDFMISTDTNENGAKATFFVNKSQYINILNNNKNNNLYETYADNNNSKIFIDLDNVELTKTNYKKLIQILEVNLLDIFNDCIKNFKKDNKDFKFSWKLSTNKYCKKTDLLFENQNYIRNSHLILDNLIFKNSFVVGQIIFDLIEKLKCIRLTPNNKYTEIENEIIKHIITPQINKNGIKTNIIDKSIYSVGNEPQIIEKYSIYPRKNIRMLFNSKAKTQNNIKIPIDIDCNILTDINNIDYSIFNLTNLPIVNTIYDNISKTKKEQFKETRKIKTKFLYNNKFKIKDVIITNKYELLKHIIENLTQDEWTTNMYRSLIMVFKKYKCFDFELKSIFNLIKNNYTKYFADAECNFEYFNKIYNDVNNDNNKNLIDVKRICDIFNNYNDVNNVRKYHILNKPNVIDMRLFNIVFKFLNYTNAEITEHFNSKKLFNFYGDWKLMWGKPLLRNTKSNQEIFLEDWNLNNNNPSRIHDTNLNQNRYNKNRKIIHLKNVEDMTEYVLNENLKWVVICGEWGCSKTNNGVKQLIEQNRNKKTIYMNTDKNNNAEKLSKQFDMVNHQNLKKITDTEKLKKLKLQFKQNAICSNESNYEALYNSYDIGIYDEIDGLLLNFNSSTMETNGKNVFDIHDNFINIMNKHEKCLFLDNDIDENLLSTLHNQIKDNPHYKNDIVNNGMNDNFTIIHIEPKLYTGCNVEIIDNDNAFLNEILTQINNNQTNFVFSIGKKNIDKFINSMKKHLEYSFTNYFNFFIKELNIQLTDEDKNYIKNNYSNHELLSKYFLDKYTQLLKSIPNFNKFSQLLIPKDYRISFLNADGITIYDYKLEEIENQPSKKNTLQDVNKIIKDYKIKTFITSPTMTTGSSIHTHHELIDGLDISPQNMRTFKNTFGLINGHKTIYPKSFTQGLQRNRKQTDKILITASQSIFDTFKSSIDINDAKLSLDESIKTFDDKQIKRKNYYEKVKRIEQTTSKLYSIFQYVEYNEIVRNYYYLQELYKIFYYNNKFNIKTNLNPSTTYGGFVEQKESPLIDGKEFLQDNNIIINENENENENELKANVKQFDLFDFEFFKDTILIDENISNLLYGIRIEDDYYKLNKLSDEYKIIKILCIIKYHELIKFEIADKVKLSTLLCSVNIEYHDLIKFIDLNIIDKYFNQLNLSSKKIVRLIQIITNKYFIYKKYKLNPYNHIDLALYEEITNSFLKSKIDTINDMKDFENIIQNNRNLIQEYFNFDYNKAYHSRKIIDSPKEQRKLKKIIKINTIINLLNINIIDIYNKLINKNKYYEKQIELFGFDKLTEILKNRFEYNKDLIKFIKTLFEDISYLTEKESKLYELFNTDKIEWNLKQVKFIISIMNEILDMVNLRLKQTDIKNNNNKKIIYIKFCNDNILLKNESVLYEYKKLDINSIKFQILNNDNNLILSKKNGNTFKYSISKKLLKSSINNKINNQTDIDTIKYEIHDINTISKLKIIKNKYCRNKTYKYADIKFEKTRKDILTSILFRSQNMNLTDDEIDLNLLIEKLQLNKKIIEKLGNIKYNLNLRHINFKEELVKFANPLKIYL